MIEGRGKHLIDYKIHGQWIPGCKFRYSVTKDGLVFSFVYEKIRELTVSVNDRGYRTVNLRLDKMCRSKIHQLVAITYIGPRVVGKEVHHIDGDKFNNNVDNLKYVTKSENMKESFKLGRVPKMGENHYAAKLTEDQAKEIYKSKLSMGQLAKIFSVSRGAIRAIKCKKNWKQIHND